MDFLDKNIMAFPIPNWRESRERKRERERKLHKEKERERERDNSRTCYVLTCHIAFASMTLKEFKYRDHSVSTKLCHLSGDSHFELVMVTHSSSRRPMI